MWTKNFQTVKPPVTKMKISFQLPASQLNFSQTELLKTYETGTLFRHAGWLKLAPVRLSDPNSDLKCLRHVSTKTHN